MNKSLYLKNLIVVIIILLSLGSPTKIYAQTLESSIDSLLNAKYTEDAPGASFLISRNGNIIYIHRYPKFF